jgi:hypothetical protein
MSLRHRTQFLALLVVFCAAMGFFALLHLDTRRGEALAAQRDFNAVHKDLAELTQANSAGNRVTVGRLDESELSRRLTNAAAVAGVADKLTGIEPNQPKPIGNSDYKELEVYIFFKDITVQQLTVFLHTLAQNDPGSRAKTIDLEPPENAPSASPAGAGGEMWTANVAVAYLMYAPRENQPQ